MDKFWSVEDILKIISEEVQIIGDPNLKRFNRTALPLEADREALIWISPTKEGKEQLLQNTRAEIIIAPSNMAYGTLNVSGKCILVVENPRKVFVEVVNALFKEEVTWGIHATAVISDKAQIHPKTYIGPYCTVGHASIGEGTILRGHNYIYDRVQIGKNCILQAGAIIGADGLGHIRNKENRLENFVHLGSVVIEDEVEIGVHSTVSKGTIGDTVIQKGVKIDCHVQIGHNARLEENVMIASHSVVGGSTVIQKDTWVGLGSTIIDNIVVGENAHIGPASLIMGNVEKETKYVAREAMKLPSSLPKR